MESNTESASRTRSSVLLGTRPRQVVGQRVPELQRLIETTSDAGLAKYASEVQAKLAQFHSLGGTSDHLANCLREIDARPDAALAQIDYFLDINMPTGPGAMPSWMQDAYQDAYGSSGD